MQLRGKLTTKQAAARLGVCISALRRMVYAGTLKEIRISKHIILYDEAEVSRVKRMIDGRPVRLGRPRTKEPWNNGDGDGQ